MKYPTMIPKGRERIHHKPPKVAYVESRDNPPAPTRPGSDQHQQYRSRTTPDKAAVERNNRMSQGALVPERKDES